MDPTVPHDIEGPPPGAALSHGGTARPLAGNVAFRRLWAAQALSAVGARITRTALPILAILSLDASAAEIALLSTLTFAPGLAVSLFGGGAVDRNPKRPLMIGADLFRAALLLTVPLAAWAGVLGMAQVYLVAGLVGMATTLFGIADNTFLPVIVGRPDLTAANARLEATESVAEGIGPWLGGVLVSLIGAPLALAADAVSYLWSALMLRRIDAPEARRPREADEGTGALADARAGLRAAQGHPLVWRLLAVAVILALSGGFFFALYMVVTIDTLGLSPATTGLIIGVGGIGGAGGALLAPWLKARSGVPAALALSLAIAVAFNFAVPLALVWREVAVPLLISAQLVGDGFMTAFMILALSLRQEVIDDRLLGRVNATFHLGEGLALTLGTLLAGALVLVLPVEAVIWGAALGGVVAVPVLLTGIRRAT